MKPFFAFLALCVILGALRQLLSVAPSGALFTLVLGCALLTVAGAVQYVCEGDRRAKRDADAEKDNARYAARTLIRLGIVLPARLKMLCQKHGLSVAEIAREAGVE